MCARMTFKKKYNNNNNQWEGSTITWLFEMDEGSCLPPANDKEWGAGRKHKNWATKYFKLTTMLLKNNDKEF